MELSHGVRYQGFAPLRNSLNAVYQTIISMGTSAISAAKRTSPSIVVAASTLGFGAFFFRRWVSKKRAENKVVFCKCESRLNDKVVVITGATSGIGYQVALMSALQQATVIFGARDHENGRAIAEHIRWKSSNRRVHCLYLDLADFQSCKRFCDKVHEMEPVIDFLVNNAAIFNQTPERTKDGFEKTWQTNFLSCIIITENLLGNVGVGVSEHAGVIFVSSATRLMVNPSDVVNVEQMRDVPEITTFEEGIGHYALTKMALWIYAAYMAFGRMNRKGLFVASVDPGSVWTRLFRDSWMDLSGLYTRFKCMLCLRTPVEGAQTIMHCMNCPKITNGVLLKDCQEICFPPEDAIQLSPEFVSKSYKLISKYLPSDCKAVDEIKISPDLSFDEGPEGEAKVTCC